MKRPILVVLIGYIIGIIWGLYFRISIAFLYLFVIICGFIVKKIIENMINKQNKMKKVNNKLKILKILILSKNFKKILFLISISALISNCIVKYLNNDYNIKYKNIQKAVFIGTIIEERQEKQYYLQYKIKIEKINNKKVKQHQLLLKLKNKKSKLQIGDKIQFEGEYQEPQGQRNTKGFNYKLYLKSQKIYGLVITNYTKILKHNNQTLFQKISTKLLVYSQNSIQALITNKDEKDLLQGLLIGKDDNMEDELKESFNNSSLSHILAISGMHVTYIISGIMFVFNSMKFSKKSSKILLIFLLILFCGITNFSTTVVRAVFMSVISIIATLVYRKNDIITTMSITLLLILLNNPFALFNIGLILSFLGTIGVVLFYKILLEEYSKKNKELFLANGLTIIEKMYKKIIEVVIVSISAQLCILPIIIYNFNKFSLNFIISNILVSFVIGLILVLGFFLILFNFLFSPIAKIIVLPLSFVLQILIKIAKLVENLPICNILLQTPNIIFIIIYYILLFVFFVYYKKDRFKICKKSNVEKCYLQKSNMLRKTRCIKNRTILRFLISNKVIHKLSTSVDNLCGYFVKMGKNIVIVVSIVCITFFIYAKVNNSLNIYFIDVGQGDSTLIITPNNKKILIDGGGRASKEFDVGKFTLIPYLLDRGIKNLDYIIVSHFDIDHCRSDCLQ